MKVYPNAGKYVEELPVGPFFWDLVLLFYLLVGVQVDM